MAGVNSGRTNPFDASRHSSSTACRGSVRGFSQSEAQYPGFLAKFLTHPVDGLESYRMLFDQLTTAREAIKVYCNVAPL